MVTKFIMLALSSFVLPSQGDPSDTKESLFELIKKSIHAELSSIGFNFLIGVLLMLTFVFSLIQLGQAFQAWIRQFENGYNIELVIFGLLAIFSSVLLFLLFNRIQKKPSQKKQNPQPMPTGIDLPIIGLRFVEGIIDGFDLGKRSRHFNLSKEILTVEKLD